MPYLSHHEQHYPSEFSKFIEYMEREVSHSSGSCSSADLGGTVGNVSALAAFGVLYMPQPGAMIQPNWQAVQLGIGEPPLLLNLVLLPSLLLAQHLIT